MLAHFEAKPTLTKDTLTAALANQVATQEVIAGYRNPAEVWRGIFFAKVPESRTVASVFTTLRGVLSDPIALAEAMPQATVEFPRRLELTHLPDCLVGLEGPVCFFGTGTTDRVSRIRAFDAGKASVACAMCDLFAHVRAALDPRHQFGEFDEVIQNAVGCHPTIAELELPPERNDDR